MGMSKEDLAAVGLVDERVKVHPDLVQPLRKVDVALQGKGCRLYITEGYRSPELYSFVHKKIEETKGKGEADRVLNLRDKPHATGKAIDAVLWDKSKQEPIIMRDKSEGFDAYFVDYYKNSEDPKRRAYHELQSMLINLMQDNGFRLGIKREYFHFNYAPQMPRSY